MSRILPPKHPFSIAEDGISLMESAEPAKVTGTSLGAVVGRSPWETPFTTACRLFGLFREDIGDKPAIRTGVVLEPKILEYCKAVPAEEIFAKREGDHDSWLSDFEDPDFAGHIDGMMEDGRVAEVKTTNDLSKWENGVPEHYWLQASLYSLFLADGADISFLVGVVDEDTYRDPYSWTPEGNVFRFDVPMHPETERIIEYARAWRRTLCETLHTPCPDLTDPRDARVYNELRNMTMTEDELKQLMTDILATQDELDAYESAVADIRKELDEKKESLKTQMVMRNLRQIEVAGNKASVTEQKREVFDLAKARADGMAVDDYVSMKTTNVLRFKRSKEE